MQQQRLGAVGVRDANALRQRVGHEYVVRVRPGDVVRRCSEVHPIAVEPVPLGQLPRNDAHALDVLLQVERQPVEYGLQQRRKRGHSRHERLALVLEAAAAKHVQVQVVDRLPGVGPWFTAIR